jgi:hypothetical protein
VITAGFTDLTSRLPLRAAVGRGHRFRHPVSDGEGGRRPPPRRSDSPCHAPEATPATAPLNGHKPQRPAEQPTVASH